jgi:hypothetical protein
LDKVQQRVLILAALAATMFGTAAPGNLHFYPDDPIWRMPPPQPVNHPHDRSIDQLYDFIINSVATPGEKQLPGALIPSKDVNTLGEVPDSQWYTNRHYWHPMSMDELRRGPARGNEPVPPFVVVGAKSEGVTPGFQLKDARGRRYVCKIDPESNPEMATAADVVGSKFFYALGYNVPENYILYFARRELSIDPKARITPKGGRRRPMLQSDLDQILDITPRNREGRYRVMASLFVEGKGIGPFRWYGTRRDDPDDLYNHENRRALRGLYVFCAWLNHTDIKANNTYDTITEVNGVPVIRHYLIDFGASLGSDSDEPKDARFGHEYMIVKKKMVLAKMFSLGLISPDWERARFPHIRAVGNFEAKTFDADKWTSNYPNSAFLNRLPDDTFWGAKQVMAFTEPEVRTMVETGEYSNPEAVNYITRTLMERREKIGRTFFSKVLPLDRFDVRGGDLVFEDLGVKYGFARKRNYDIKWFTFDNTNARSAVIAGASGARVPAGRKYVMAEISTPGMERKTVQVYVRDGRQVVGIGRSW